MCFLSFLSTIDIVHPSFIMKDMKVKVHLRVAKTETRNGYRVSASTKPNNEPLNSGSYGTVWYPTVSFAVDLNLPDELFEQANRVIAELNVAMKDAKISSEIAVPEGITVKKAKA